jgi:hypothetical protein
MNIDISNIEFSNIDVNSKEEIINQIYKKLQEEQIFLGKFIN